MSNMVSSPADHSIYLHLHTLSKSGDRLLWSLRWFFSGYMALSHPHFDNKLKKIENSSSSLWNFNGIPITNLLFSVLPHSGQNILMIFISYHYNLIYYGI